MNKSFTEALEVIEDLKILEIVENMKPGEIYEIKYFPIFLSKPAILVVRLVGRSIIFKEILLYVEILYTSIDHPRFLDKKWMKYALLVSCCLSIKKIDQNE